MENLENVEIPRINDEVLTNKEPCYTLTELPTWECIETYPDGKEIRFKLKHSHNIIREDVAFQYFVRIIKPNFWSDEEIERRGINNNPTNNETK